MEKIKVKIWTEKFLGTRSKCEQMLHLIEEMDGGQWLPDKWGDCEPIRALYESGVLESILPKWTKERGGLTANEIFLRRHKPFCEVWVSIWRGKVPSLNSVSLSFDAKSFARADGFERLKAIIQSFIDWSQAVYANAWCTQQLHLPQAQWTPEKRLERADWLMFFGKPYLELFGGEQRVLDSPCFSAERISGGVLLLAASSHNSPELTQHDDTLLTLENYLGADAFAKEHFPEVPCRVPVFNLAETVKLEDGEGEPALNQGSIKPLLITDPDTGKATAVAVLAQDSRWIV